MVQLDFLGVNDGGTVGVEVEGTGRGSLPNTTADWGLRIIITYCSGKTNDAFKNTSGDNDYFVLPTNSSWYSLVVEVEGTGRGSLPNTTADWGSEDHYHLLQRENE